MSSNPSLPHPTGQKIDKPSPLSPARSTPSSNAISNKQTEVARNQTLNKDRHAFQDFQQRTTKRTISGPFKVKPPPRISSRTIDTETTDKIAKGNQHLSRFLYSLANEPSIGLYHVNEHVRRSVPKIVSIKKDLIHQKTEANKSSIDLDEFHPTVTTIAQLKTFSNIKQHLQKSIQLSTPTSSSSGFSFFGSKPTQNPRPATTSEIAPSSSKIPTQNSESNPPSVRLPTAKEPQLPATIPEIVSAAAAKPEESSAVPIEPVQHRTQNTTSEQLQPNTLESALSNSPQAANASSPTASFHSPPSSGPSSVTDEHQNMDSSPIDNSSISPTNSPSNTDESLSSEALLLGHMKGLKAKKKKQKAVQGTSESLVPKNF